MEIVNNTVASLVMELAPENVSIYGNGTIEKILESLEVMPDPRIKLAHDILICVLLVSVMFAMGCHITVSEVSKFSLIIIIVFFTITIVNSKYHTIIYI